MITIPHQKDFFEEMYKDHYSALLNFAKNLLFDSDEAKDVVQEAFLDLWRQGREIQVATTLRSYLFSCVKNRALTRIQHLNVIDKHKDQLKEAYLSAYNLDDFDDEEMIKEVRGMLDALPEQMRQVVAYHCLYGWSYKDIAEEMGIGVNTVKTHMKRAFQKFRMQYNERNLNVLMVFLIVDMLYR